MEITLLKPMKTNLVQLICQQTVSGVNKKYESVQFPFHGNLSREQRLDYIPSKTEIRPETKIFFTTQFLIKENGLLFCNEPTINLNEIDKINKQELERN